MGDLPCNGPLHEIDLDCGISYARIASWLDDELALPRDQERWLYVRGTESCLIALEPLENRTLGNISLERTHLTVDGDPAAIAAFEKLFTLRFISAGG